MGLMKMYMPRDFVLRSVYGPVVEFIANEPVAVPPLAVDEAIAVGGVFVDKKEQKVLVEEKPVIKEPSMGFVREQELFDACAVLADRNSTEDFTPQGKPKLEAVKDIVGYGVDRKELNTIWSKVLVARNNAA